MGVSSNITGLVASVALHALAFGYVATRQPPPPPAPHEAGAEFVFIDTPPPPPPPVEPPHPPEPARTPEPKKTPAVSKVKTAVAPPSEVKPPADTPVSDAPTDAPTAAAVAPAPRLNLGLVPSGSFALKLSIDAGIDDGNTGLHGLDAPKDLAAATAKETIGRGRVDRGLVHPYYSQLGKALIKNWDADRVARSGLKGFAENTVANFKLANEIWLDRAAQFGKSGQAVDSDSLGNNRHAPVTNQIQGIQGTDLEARKELQRQMKNQWTATRRAVIRVVQDQSGKLLKVELVEPSNDSNVDKEALKDVRAAAEKLPPPPTEALEGKTQLSSLWSFELIISISPPIPTINFEFDEVVGFIDARLPLDRRIYKKVRLVSVE